MVKDETEAVAMIMAEAMFRVACGAGRVIDYDKERQRYYLPKARAVLKVFCQSTSTGDSLAEQAAEASFIATENPIGWRYSDYRIYYLPGAQAALAEAAASVMKANQ